jgi:cytochrome P450
VSHETSCDPVHRLTRRRTLLLAGHDTSANSLTWFLWELAKHPESAQEIREEIAAVRARIGARDFSITDLEGMSTMLAALKVI